MSVGERIQARRQALSLSQEEAARRAGLSLQQFGRIERGTSTPRLDTASALAEVLETTVDYLAGYGDDNAETSTTAKQNRVARALRAPVNYLATRVGDLVADGDSVKELTRLLLFLARLDGKTGDELAALLKSMEREYAADDSTRTDHVTESEPNYKR